MTAVVVHTTTKSIAITTITACLSIAREECFIINKLGFK
jgi:hypothetical protein